MRQMIGTVLFFILIGTSLALSIYGHLPDRRPAPRPRFDIATARRESHALGLPFPESDGTLSLPPEPKPTADCRMKRSHVV